MKKSTDVELMQLKKAIEYLADGLDNLAAIYRKEAKGSPLQDFLAGSARVAGDQVVTLRLLVGEVEKLSPKADDGDIAAAVGRAAQAALRKRANPLDLTAMDTRADDLLARIRHDAGLG